MNLVMDHCLVSATRSKIGSHVCPLSSEKRGWKWTPSFSSPVGSGDQLRACSSLLASDDRCGQLINVSAIPHPNINEHLCCTHKSHF